MFNLHLLYEIIICSHFSNLQFYNIIFVFNTISFYNDYKLDIFKSNGNDLMLFINHNKCSINQAQQDINYNCKLQKESCSISYINRHFKFIKNKNKL